MPGGPTKPWSKPTARVSIRSSAVQRDWCRNLVDNRDEAVAEVGLATAKVWGLYMAARWPGFETNVVQLHQVLAVKLDGKGGDGGLPLRQWWTA